MSPTFMLLIIRFTFVICHKSSKIQRLIRFRTVDLPTLLFIGNISISFCYTYKGKAWQNEVLKNITRDTNSKYMHN
ncbi:hypothetical protein PRABACTJOHN_02701 [Parabacteroides johnsonii DSM 18315]|uniref:Uncharacterized protein n=1 Tax=Parabacteroides johnsonii DSM 18315 TaxID=537006 RepID=B7BCD2_9BACT|nr:hypothetical protein PRABACTJOHN_02701 [Parabacteroides johnsonii DSM 18315]